MPSQLVVSHGVTVVVFVPDAKERAWLDSLEALRKRAEEVKEMRKQYKARWRPKSAKELVVTAEEMTALIEQCKAAVGRRRKKELKAELIKAVERKANAEWQQKRREYAELLAAEAALEDEIQAARSSRQRGS